MSKTKFTGWHVDRSEGTKIKDAQGDTVLWTQHTHLHGRRTDEEVMEIANLAAAAPEMLEALSPFSKLGGTILAEAPPDAKTVVVFRSATGEKFAIALDQFRSAISAVTKATGGPHDKE